MKQVEFQVYLQEYLLHIQEAKQKKAHHDQLRNIFMGFLDKAFGVKYTEVELEKNVKLSEVRGYIDALYQDIIFEFKRDLSAEREKGLQELLTYIKSLKKTILASLQTV